MFLVVSVKVTPSRNPGELRCKMRAEPHNPTTVTRQGKTANRFGTILVHRVPKVLSV